MTARVLLFARAAELAGSAAVEVELPGGASVADLRRALAEARPDLAAFLPKCAVAVDREFAPDGAPVPAGAELAVLPPVSGG